MKLKLEEIETTPIEEQHKEDVLLLADSIKEQGLLHKPVVHRVNGKLQVVIGNKRIAALKLLGYETVDCDFSDKPLSEIEVKIKRVHENLKRYNLPWYEQVELTETLHELRQDEHGDNTNKGPVKVGWSMRDTAKELGISLGRVSEDIMLSNALKADKTLKNITDKKTALRLVRQMARRITAEEEAGVEVDIDINQVYNGDSVEILKRLPDRTFDLCITDPPWQDFKFEGLTSDSSTLPVFKELWRVMKHNSFIYVFVGIDDFIFYRRELPKIGWTLQNHPLIWSKPNVLSKGVRAWEYGRDLELVVVGIKGSPVLTVSTQLSSILTFNAIIPQKLVHPNEKPVDLIETLMSHSSYDGSLVIDPFAGSGVVGVAAKNSSRRYVLIERDRVYYDKIVQRVGETSK